MALPALKMSLLFDQSPVGFPATRISKMPSKAVVVVKLGVQVCWSEIRDEPAGDLWDRRSTSDPPANRRFRSYPQTGHISVAASWRS
jgi:hypothetical protein